MAEYLAPGVYVEDSDTERTLIPYIYQTITAFIGKTLEGIDKEPILLHRFDEFTDHYGGYLPITETNRQLAYAVEQFFMNGGHCCYIIPIINDDYIGIDGGTGKRSGIQKLLDLDDVTLVAIPGVTDLAIQKSLTAVCETKKTCFAILDYPENIKKGDDLKIPFHSDYAAVYHPWLLTFDHLTKTNHYVAPSGAMAGVYTRVDEQRGIFKAPANEIMRCVVGLSANFDKTEQDLATINKINLIRAMPSMGIRVWGARTLSSENEWKYVNIKRFSMTIERGIVEYLKTETYAVNDHVLWNQVKKNIENFMYQIWRDGALMGTKPEEAYIVEVGPQTMTQNDIQNGRLFLKVGYALTRPGEFHVAQFMQQLVDDQ